MEWRFKGQVVNEGSISIELINLRTLKHSSSEKGKVTMINKKDRIVANLSTHPAASGFAVTK